MGRRGVGDEGTPWHELYNPCRLGICTAKRYDLQNILSEIGPLFGMKSWGNAILVLMALFFWPRKYITCILDFQILCLLLEIEVVLA